MEEGSAMNRREAPSRRRRISRSVELLDDRLVLSAVTAGPVTPAPTASPFQVAHIGKFEHELQRADRGLKIHSKHPVTYVTTRLDYIQNVTARVASRAHVQAQQVTVTSTSSSSSGTATHGRAQTNQVDRLVASFNSGSSTPTPTGSTLPVNAIENNLAGARAGVKLPARLPPPAQSARLGHRSSATPSRQTPAQSTRLSMA
jgi:hypothetical protein